MPSYIGGTLAFGPQFSLLNYVSCLSSDSLQLLYINGKCRRRIATTVKDKVSHTQKWGSELKAMLKEMKQWPFSVQVYFRRFD